MAPFGPGHTALNGIRCSTTRREPPCAAAVCWPSLVASVVVAAACGGDSNEQADPAPDPASVAPTSVAVPEADRSDIERLTAAAEPQVQLGDRFTWHDGSGAS